MDVGQNCAGDRPSLALDDNCLVHPDYAIAEVNAGELLKALEGLGALQVGKGRRSGDKRVYAQDLAVACQLEDLDQQLGITSIKLDSCQLAHVANEREGAKNRTDRIAQGTRQFHPLPNNLEHNLAQTKAEVGHLPRGCHSDCTSRVEQ